MMRIIVPLLVIGLMSVSAGVAFGDSHGDGGNATSTDDGMATSTDDGLATSTDDGMATSTDDGMATSTDDGLATSTDDGLATSTDDGLATSTDPGLVEGDGDGYKGKSFPGVVRYLGDEMVTIGKDDSDETVTLAGGDSGETVNVNLSGATVKTPGGPNNRGTFEKGARVVVHAEWNGTEWVAIWVIVKPVKPTFIPIVGTAIGTEDGVTTILLPNGKTKKIEKPKGAEDPEDGEVLTVIVENTGDGDGEGDADADGEPAQATGLVKASKVAARIQSFLEKLAAKDAKLPQAAIDARQRLVSNLAAVLEEHSAQHVSIIEKASKAQGLGSGTAAGIQRALEKAQAGQAKGKAIADEAKSKVGPGQNAGKGPKNIFGPNSSGDDDGDDADSGGPGKPDGSGKPANAGSQGSNKGNKGNSGD